jgi:putative tryptophan/tyrosine transport system substrate-binding protein
MRRREFLGVLGGAAATWPVAARGQQAERVRRIGVLHSSNESDPEEKFRISVFVQSLQKLGWREGGNLVIDYRFGGDKSERMRLNAAELVNLKPDVIWTVGGLGLLQLKRATRTIPIVFTQLYDPVGSGFVVSLAQPGGNITGFSLGEFSLGGKTLEVLREMVPQLSRVAVILNIEQPPHVAMWSTIRAMAVSAGVRSTAMDVQEAAELKRAIEDFSGESNGGLIVLPSPFTTASRELIIALTAKHHLPAAYAYPNLVKAGGLMSYGMDPADFSLQAATYIDRILKGAKPGDLPIQQPTKFRLVINLRTAKALGLIIPESFLLRADEVIE